MRSFRQAAGQTSQPPLRSNSPQTLCQPAASLPPRRYDYVYLCGFTATKYPGLHPALAPDAPATARAVTYNGLKITVSGARRLEIPSVPDGY